MAGDETEEEEEDVVQDYDRAWLPQRPVQLRKGLYI